MIDECEMIDTPPPHFEVMSFMNRVFVGGPFLLFGVRKGAGKEAGKEERNEKGRKKKKKKEEEKKEKEYYPLKEKKKKSGKNNRR